MKFSNPPPYPADVVAEFPVMISALMVNGPVTFLLEKPVELE
jgi:hypothetical protein